MLLRPPCACSCTYLSTHTQMLSPAPSCTGSALDSAPWPRPLTPLALLSSTQAASKRVRLHLGQLPGRPGCSSRTTGRSCGRSHGQARSPSTSIPAASEGERGTRVMEPAAPDCHPDSAACQHLSLHTGKWARKGQNCDEIEKCTQEVSRNLQTKEFLHGFVDSALSPSLLHTGKSILSGLGWLAGERAFYGRRRT